MSATHHAPRWKPIAAAAATALAVAMAGGLLTDIGTWYYGLKKPSWQPPDWLFAPAWTVIFALTALSGVIAWRHAPTARTRGWILAFFALNALLNLLWTGLFFRLQRPDWALVEVALLWLSVLLLIVSLAPISGTASWLLVPYLLWVTFAGLLNYTVVQLNYPFAAG